MFEYKAHVREVIEGDVLRLKLDLGCDIRIDLVAALQGVRCPHLGEENSEKAFQFTTAWVRNRGCWVLVNTVKCERDEPGRYKVWVHDWLGNSLNRALIQMGLGVSLSA